MSDVFQAYPAWRFHPTQPARVVNDAAEDAALGEGWLDSHLKLPPAAEAAVPVPVPPPPAAVPVPVVPEPEPEPEPTPDPEPEPEPEPVPEPVHARKPRSRRK